MLAPAVERVEVVERHLVRARVEGLVLAASGASSWSTTSTLSGRDHLDGRVLPLAAPPLGREVQHNGAAARLPGEESANRLVRDARPLDIAGREEPRHVPGEVRGERGAGARGGSPGSDVRGGRNGNRGPGNVSDGRRTPGRAPLGVRFLRHFRGMRRLGQSRRDFVCVARDFNPGRAF